MMHWTIPTVARWIVIGFAVVVAVLAFSNFGRKYRRAGGNVIRRKRGRHGRDINRRIGRVGFNRFINISTSPTRLRAVK